MESLWRLLMTLTLSGEEPHSVSRTTSGRTPVEPALPCSLNACVRSRELLEELRTGYLFDAAV